MNEAVQAALGAGTRVLYDGQWWEVAGLIPPSVLLATAAELRRVSISHLLAAPGTRIGEAEAPAWEADLRLAGRTLTIRGAFHQTGDDVVLTHTSDTLTCLALPGSPRLPGTHRGDSGPRANARSAGSSPRSAPSPHGGHDKGPGCGRERFGPGAGTAQRR